MTMIVNLFGLSVKKAAAPRDISERHPEADGAGKGIGRQKEKQNRHAAVRKTGKSCAGYRGAIISLSGVRSSRTIRQWTAS